MHADKAILMPADGAVTMRASAAVHSSASIICQVKEGNAHAGQRRRSLFIFLLILGSLLLPTRLFAQVSDGAHGGDEHFFFLPPIASDPNPTGTFLASLAPVVQVCELAANDCVLSPLAEFTTSTSGSERVRVVPRDEHYIVNFNWRRRPDLDATKTFRIRVLLRFDGIEDELGHADVTVGASPIKFRIEQGASPIGELEASTRAKIEPTLIEELISQAEPEPVEALVNMAEHPINLPPLPGVEIVEDFRPTLATLHVRIDDPTALASLVQPLDVRYVYENRHYQLLAEEWQERIGQDAVANSGYLGGGAVIAMLDDGGQELYSRDPLPGVDLGDGSYDVREGIIDLSHPVFGGCTDVGTPATCRVIAEDGYIDEEITDHATRVALRIAKTAAGADIIALDFFAGNLWRGSDVARAAEWLLENVDQHNIVAFNMSFATPTIYPPDACPTAEDYWFQKLRDAGIMPIASSGNDGFEQEFELNAFDGISHPGCSPLVVGVGGTTNDDQMWHKSTRGPNLDLVAPASGERSTGTSISAPTVSGAWAILRIALPNLALDETLQLLKETGEPIFDPASGLTFPRVQIDAALRSAGLPVVHDICPCFTGDDLAGLEWDIWCTASQTGTLSYLLINWPESDPGPIYGSDPRADAPSCFTGRFYEIVERATTASEAEACAALIAQTGTLQGVTRACRID